MTSALRTVRHLLAAGLAAALIARGWAGDASKAAKSLQPPPLSPRFQQVRDRTDALLHYRSATPPPPDPRCDPFRAPGAVAAPSAPSEPTSAANPEPAVLADDFALLQQAAATLKVTGTFERLGIQHLIINGRPYKEGDAIQTQVQGQPVVLRVRQISRYSVTLALNAAELPLKF